MALKTPISRFEAKFEPVPWTGCWIWLGSTRHGYGAFRFNGTTYIASRVSYMLYKGDIPEGQVVCHTCNNPVCVNPEHLYVGSLSDNIQQSVREGRNFSPRGELHGQSKLTAEQVLAIREDQRSQRKIAHDFGISQFHVSQIKRNLTWRHL